MQGERRLAIVNPLPALPTIDRYGSLDSTTLSSQNKCSTFQSSPKPAPPSRGVVVHRCSHQLPSSSTQHKCYCHHNQSSIDVHRMSISSTPYFPPASGQRRVSESNFMSTFGHPTTSSIGDQMLHCSDDHRCHHLTVPPSNEGIGNLARGTQSMVNSPLIGNHLHPHYRQSRLSHDTHQHLHPTGHPHQHAMSPNMHHSSFMPSPSLSHSSRISCRTNQQDLPTTNQQPTIRRSSQPVSSSVISSYGHNSAGIVLAYATSDFCDPSNPAMLRFHKNDALGILIESITPLSPPTVTPTTANTPPPYQGFHLSSANDHRVQVGYIPRWAVRIAADNRLSLTSPPASIRTIQGHPSKSNGMVQKVDLAIQTETYSQDDLEDDEETDGECCSEDDECSGECVLVSGQKTLDASTTSRRPITRLTVPATVDNVDGQTSRRNSVTSSDSGRDSTYYAGSSESTSSSGAGSGKLEMTSLDGMTGQNNPSTLTPLSPHRSLLVTAGRPLTCPAGSSPNRLIATNADTESIASSGCSSTSTTDQHLRRGWSKSTHQQTYFPPASGLPSCLLSGAHLDDEQQELVQWLESVGLTRLSHPLIEAGFDLATLVRTTPEELNACGLTNPTDRHQLRSELSHLSALTVIDSPVPEVVPSDNTPSSVFNWLQSLKLTSYWPILSGQNLIAFDRLAKLTWEDLEELGIGKIGHQKKLLLAITQLNQPQQSPAQQQTRNAQTNAGWNALSQKSSHLSQNTTTLTSSISEEEATNTAASLSFKSFTITANKSGVDPTPPASSYLPTSPESTENVAECTSSHSNPHHEQSSPSLRDNSPDCPSPPPEFRDIVLDSPSIDPKDQLSSSFSGLDGQQWTVTNQNECRRLSCNDDYSSHLTADQSHHRSLRLPTMTTRHFSMEQLAFDPTKLSQCCQDDLSSTSELRPVKKQHSPTFDQDIRDMHELRAMLDNLSRQLTNPSDL